jgi:hypothetical protein
MMLLREEKTDRLHRRSVFFAAFAYVYFFRSKGLLNGLVAVNVVRAQEPGRWDAELETQNDFECELKMTAFISEAYQSAVQGGVEFGEDF